MPARKSRPAITGRYVKPATAKRNPKTTVTETNRKAGAKSNAKRKK